MIKRFNVTMELAIDVAEDDPEETTADSVVNELITWIGDRGWSGWATCKDTEDNKAPMP